MNIAFRVDASAQIGTGHFARCLTLADALRAAGTQTRLIARHIPDAMAHAAQSAGHALSVLPYAEEPASDTAHAAWLGTSQQVDARATADALQAEGCDWLVVDHYALDAVWETALRSSARRLLVIDDLADRPHDCDVLVDQNLQPEGPNCYDGLLPEDCRALIGPRYALLRSEFRDAPPRASESHVRRINIFFGGIDGAGMTLRALDEIAHLLASGVFIDVVVGLGNPQLKTIRQRCSALGAALHVQSAEMARLFAAADLGLGAGGATSWERCRMGLPSVVVSVAGNQRSGCKALVEQGAAICLGDATNLAPGAVRAAVDALALDASARGAMAQRGQALVDGRGTARVALAMLSDHIMLRQARYEDAEMTWAWRDHPNTRRFFHDSGRIPWSTHMVWWREAVHAPDRAMLIAQCGGLDVGVLRFDCDDCKALVSIYLDPALTGLGLGAAILRAGAGWIAANRADIVRLHAEILPQNSQSAQAFASAGYVRQSDMHWIRGVH